LKLIKINENSAFKISAMKIFTVSFFLLFCIYNTSLFAQGFSFDSAMPTNEIIPVEGKGFLLMSSQLTPIDSVVLIYFDIKAQPQSSVTISLKREVGELNLEDIFVWDSKVIVLKSLFYSGQQRNRLLLYEYSLPDLELVDSQQLTEAINPSDLRLPFYYDLSPDSSQILITSWSFIASDSLAQMTMTIFDQEWKGLETRKRKLPYENEAISVYGCKIDNEANCYILGDVYTGKNINYIKQSEITTFMIASFQGATEVKAYELEIPEMTIDNWYFELDQQQNLVAIGLFKEGIKALIEGSIFFRIDKKTKTIKKYTQRVDKEEFVRAFELNLLGFRTPKNRFISYNLSSVIFKKNAYYLVAESLNTTVSEMRDILVINIDLSGKIKWLRRLPKAQKLEIGENTFASFALVEQQKYLLFFYNGNIANFEKKHDDRVKTATVKNAALCVTKLNLITQKITRQELSSVFPKGYVIQPQFCKKMADDKVVIMANERFSNFLPVTKFNTQILTVGK